VGFKGLEVLRVSAGLHYDEMTSRDKGAAGPVRLRLRLRAILVGPTAPTLLKSHIRPPSEVLALGLGLEYKTKGVSLGEAKPRRRSVYHGTCNYTRRFRDCLIATPEIPALAQYVPHFSMGRVGSTREAGEAHRPSSAVLGLILSSSHAPNGRDVTTGATR